MLRESHLVCLRAQLGQQARRTLDVGEEQGDKSRTEVSDARPTITRGEGSSVYSVRTRERIVACENWFSRGQFRADGRNESTLNLAMRVESFAA
jgi:hypothetical protein